MKDSAVIINWGFRFLKGGGEASAHQLSKVYSNILGSNNVSIICAGLCLTLNKLKIFDRPRCNVIQLPMPVVYWSSCASSLSIFRVIKQVLKWGSITLFELIAFTYVMLFKRGALYITSELFLLALLLSYTTSPKNVYLRLHGPVKNKLHAFLCKLGRFYIISNGNDALYGINDGERVIKLSVPLPSYFNITEADIKSKWMNTSYQFIYVGRLEFVKGADRLVNYIKLISKSVKIKSIDICGVGTLMKNIREDSKCNFDFPSNMLGTLSREEVASLLSKSHFLLLPSRADFAPNVVREAHSMGCVVITSPELSPQFSGMSNVMSIEEIDRIGEFIPYKLLKERTASTDLEQWKKLLFE